MTDRAGGWSGDRNNVLFCLYFVFDFVGELNFTGIQNPPKYSPGIRIHHVDSVYKVVPRLRVA